MHLILTALFLSCPAPAAAQVAVSTPALTVEQAYRPVNPRDPLIPATVYGDMKGGEGRFKAPASAEVAKGTLNVAAADGLTQRLNAGIAATEAEFIGCLDADSFVEPDALKEIIPSFTDARVAAVTAAMSVHRPANILQHMQNAEYIFGITLRHSIATVNGLYVTPGPFSFYRHTVVRELGGFRYGNQTEDMEMALRIQQAGYYIENAPHARVYTSAPSTLPRLVKQRTRWTSGFLRNVLGEYRGLIGNRRHGALGILMLPTALLSIGSGLLLFFLMLYQFTDRALEALAVRAGIPLSYSLLPHGSFDWFYFPASFYFLLGSATLLAMFALIAIGKRISKTPGDLKTGVLAYTLLYIFIVPLWLLRSTTDVAFGIRRNWR